MKTISIIIEIANIIPAGIRKYQKFSSKKDSSFDSSSISSQKDVEHAIVVITSHLCNNCPHFN
ncbi:MAG: hypothetical protein KAW66_04785 [Candidatus Lokiarchaeota archaeon]|nr:hypothetical protein [Candidatus Lokiarchaeota archaeon]